MNLRFKINKKYYTQWRFGVLEGVIVGLFLGLLAVSALLPELSAFAFDGLIIYFLLFDFLMACMIYVKIPKTPTKENPTSKPTAPAKPCSECGSTRRHKKTCSKAGKKN